MSVLVFKPDGNSLNWFPGADICIWNVVLPAAFKQLGICGCRHGKFPQPCKSMLWICQRAPLYMKRKGSPLPELSNSSIRRPSRVTWQWPGTTGVTVHVMDGVACSLTCVTYHDGLLDRLLIRECSHSCFAQRRCIPCPGNGMWASAFQSRKSKVLGGFAAAGGTAWEKKRVDGSCYAALPLRSRWRSHSCHQPQRPPSSSGLPYKLLSAALIFPDLLPQGPHQASISLGTGLFYLAILGGKGFKVWHKSKSYKKKDDTLIAFKIFNKEKEETRKKIITTQKAKASGHNSKQNLLQISKGKKTRMK